MMRSLGRQSICPKIAHISSQQPIDQSPNRFPHHARSSWDRAFAPSRRIHRDRDRLGSASSRRVVAGCCRAIVRPKRIFQRLLVSLVRRRSWRKRSPEHSTKRNRVMIVRRASKFEGRSRYCTGHFMVISTCYGAAVNRRNDFAALMEECTRRTDGNCGYKLNKGATPENGPGKQR
jgi:hypothetical protein